MAVKKEELWRRFRNYGNTPFDFSRNTFNYYIYLLVKAKYIRRVVRGYYTQDDIIPEMNVEELRNVAFREKIRNDHRYMSQRAHGELEFFTEKEFAL